MNDARAELNDYLETLQESGYEVKIMEFDNYYDLKVVTPDNNKLIVSIYGHDRFEPAAIMKKLEGIIEFLNLPDKEDEEW